MVKYRNPTTVVVFAMTTFYIYLIYWLVSTTKELQKLTSSAPKPRTLLLVLVPLLGMYFFFRYFWKYSKAINEVSGYDDSELFFLFIFLLPVAMVIAQRELNKLARAGE